MVSIWLLATLTVSPGPTTECQDREAFVPVMGAARSDLETLYSQGKTYIEFRDAAEKRVEAWNDHYAQARVPDALRTRMASVPGTWRLLVVAEDWCGDSAFLVQSALKKTSAAQQEPYPEHSPSIATLTVRGSSRCWRPRCVRGIGG